jgi:DNA-binding response OmpR family regulator
MESSNKDIKVLAVNSREIVLTTIAERLPDFFKIIKASSIHDAFSLLENGTTPHVIITSLKFDDNEEAGLDFLRKIRTTSNLCRTPVVILSGRCDDFPTKVRINLLERGADDFFETDVSADYLKAKLIAILRTNGTLPYPTP